MRDVIIVGGGVLGLATAFQLLKEEPGLRLTLLEKESEVAKHQTGNNSGVIHSGIYYKPGSLKAKNCVAGVKALEAFCKEHSIPKERCGKVIVATEERELPALEELYRRGQANGVPDLEMIGPERLREIEPFSVGIRALYSPNTSIVDFVAYAHALEKEIRERGGEILFSQRVVSLREEGEAAWVETERERFQAKFLINCAGLFSDRLAFPSGKKDCQIFPFRGEYYSLSSARRKDVKGLIYPVPSPEFPFLGVHLTRMINGEVEAGPNAVLALAREGYRKRDIALSDCKEFLAYPGFWKMAQRYWKVGAYELYRSFSKKAFLRDLQKLMPSLEEKDLVQGGSGVRAQAVAPDGSLLDDFSIKKSERMLHLLNAPSPAATASLAIGKEISSIYNN